MTFSSQACLCHIDKMKNYRGQFKGYLDDLAKRKPSPGGGSVAALSICLGLSLIEKAVIYSLTPKLKRQLSSLRSLRKKILPYIDRDGYLFGKIMGSIGKERAQFIKESEKLIVDIAKSCEKTFLLVKEIKSGIKQCIMSDCDIGLSLVKTALLGCILNLEANSKMFGKKNKNINSFKRSLKKWH